MRHSWLALALVIGARVASADPIEDAANRALKAYDAMQEANNKYTSARTKYDVYYAPLRPQWDVAEAKRKDAVDECAKNKRTRACHDKTLAYAAAHKDYDKLVWNRDEADPKHELDDNALKVMFADKERLKTEFNNLYATAATMFNAALKKATKASEKQRLDKRLTELEQKRASSFAAGRSVTADAKNPAPSNSSSSSSSNSSSGSSGSINSSVMDSARATGAALGHQ
jgi:hypothetical protein